MRTMNTIKTKKWNEWVTYFDVFYEELKNTPCDFKRGGVFYYHDFVMYGKEGVKYTKPVNLKVEIIGDYSYTYVKIGNEWIDIFDERFDLDVL